MRGHRLSPPLSTAFPQFMHGVIHGVFVTLQARRVRTERPQATNASTNGGDASRVGKICSYYLVAFVFPSILYPDARRVAPISACASSSTRHKTTAQGYADFRSWEGEFPLMGERIFCCSYPKSALP